MAAVVEMVMGEVLVVAVLMGADWVETVIGEVLAVTGVTGVMGVC